MENMENYFRDSKLCGFCEFCNLHDNKEKSLSEMTGDCTLDPTLDYKVNLISTCGYYKSRKILFNIKSKTYR